MNHRISLGFVFGLLITPGWAFQGDTCLHPLPHVGLGAIQIDTQGFQDSAFDGQGACGQGQYPVAHDVFFSWMPPQTGFYAIDTIGSDFDTQLRVHRGSGCAAQCLRANDDDGTSQQSRVAFYALDGSEYLIQVGGANGAFGTAHVQFSYLGFDSPCSPDDSEPNDDCSSAPLLSSGWTFSRYLELDSPDFYRVRIPQGRRLFLSFSSPRVVGRLYAGDCTPLQNPTSNPVWENASDAAVEVLVEILSAEPLSTCQEYGLHVQLENIPCANATDDSLEPNDDLPSARFLSTGIYENLRSLSNDPDYYMAMLPPHQRLRLEGSISGSADLQLLDTLGHPVGDPAPQLFVPNESSVPLEVFFRVGEAESPWTYCEDYGLRIEVEPNPCDPLGVAPDPWIGNDSCATAADLNPGAYTNLLTRTGDPDFFRVVLPSGKRLTASLTQHPPDRVKLRVLDAHCELVKSNAIVGGWPNFSEEPLILFLEIRLQTAALDCASYDLSLSIDGERCANPTYPLLGEPTCPEQGAWLDGAYRYFQEGNTARHLPVCVPPGRTVAVSAQFAASLGDLNLFLREADSAYCDWGDGPELLASSTSSLGEESLTWTNSTGARKQLSLRVELTTPACLEYDFQLYSDGFCADLGEVFCHRPAPHVSEGPALLVAFEPLFTQSTPLLQAYFGPQNEPGYLLVGNRTAEPGVDVSNGRLCLDTSHGSLIGRYNQLGSPLNTLGFFNSLGDFEVVVQTSPDVGYGGFHIPKELPEGLGGAIQPGETWHFQLWYRDGPGASNFSNGLSLTF